MKTIKQSVKINAPLMRVWKVLVEKSDIEAWGAGPNVVMDAKVGTKFELWDGGIFGKNVEVEENAKLVQEWQEKAWSTPSKVTFTLHSDDGTTTILDLLHEGIPDTEVDKINQGWKDYYLGAIKKYLEK